MKIKLIVILIIVTTIVSLFLGARWYIIDTQETITALNSQVTTLTNANQENQRTINTLRDNIELVRQEYRIVEERFSEARQRTRQLEQQLAEHNLTRLAIERPQSIQRIINSGTNDIFRCFELASGQPNTDEELNASTLSQSNDACRTLANPNLVQ